MPELITPVSNNNSSAEVNFDGLVGPTHNYGGLSSGNIASLRYKDQISNPKAAALQGLEKMRFLIDKGLIQAILPPHERPFSKVLKPLDSFGNRMTEDAFLTKNNNLLIKNVMSASPMWTANAATVSPAIDTLDGRLHFTTANLNCSFHRAIEAEQTTKVLSRIFSDKEHFVVHSAVDFFGDEGAANHSRLCKEHDSHGIEVFVFGRSAFDRDDTKFPRRQTQEASVLIAKQHGLNPKKCVFIQQSNEAIDAGVFHNDVISVINENVFLLHEKAFEDQQEALTLISDKCDFDVNFLQISEKELSLSEAISSYLFNSQLLTLADGSMTLLLPHEVKMSPKAYACVKRLIADDGNPIQDGCFLDLKQSMRNGGGPACLRLRVVMNQAQISALQGNVILNHDLINKLEDIIKNHYREQLHPSNLSDSSFIKDSLKALDEISDCLSLRGIYDFQQ